jgi:hypothetical protein
MDESANPKANENKTGIKTLEIGNLYRQEALDRIPWGEDTTPTAPNFVHDAFDTDRLLTRLDPLDAFHRLTTSHPSYRTTTRNNQSHQQALVAATELRATYEAADMSRFSKVGSKPYILHTVDDTNIPVVVSTGESVSVNPLVSDFVGPIPKPSRQSLQGLGDSTKVGQGIIEWQIQDVLGPPIPPEPPPPPPIRSSSEGDVVPSVVDALNSPPTVIPEGATSSSEGDDEQGSNQDVTSEKEVVKRVARSNVQHTVDDPHIPVIVDTGASISVSPNVQLPKIY